MAQKRIKQRLCTSVDALMWTMLAEKISNLSIPPSCNGEFGGICANLEFHTSASWHGSDPAVQDPTKFSSSGRGGTNTLLFVCSTLRLPASER